MVLHSNEVGIACMTEHWLTPVVRSGICVQGYSVAAIYCRPDVARGGVCTLVREKFPRLVPERQFMSNLNCELHFESIVVVVGTLNLVVLNVFKFPIKSARKQRYTHHPAPSQKDLEKIHVICWSQNIQCSAAWDEKFIN
ncbi:hypothetical protein J6590_021036 [Homalodisca vitripennis]|nr:hypothetical protein J6590_021036 [Homalodisca vitripennis]